MEEDDVTKTWKDYFEYLDKVDTEEMVTVHMCDLMALEEVTILGESQELRLKLKRE